MRNAFLFLFSLCIFFQTHAQDNAMEGVRPDTDDSTDVYLYTSTMPSFQGGGDNAFSDYIKSKLIYPKAAKEQGIQGTVYVQFIIEKDGSVTNVSIVPGRGVHPLLDQTAIDVIKSSPKWKPGLQNGKPVRVKKTQRIAFTLPK